MKTNQILVFVLSVFFFGESVFAGDAKSHIELLSRAHVLSYKNTKTGMSCYGYSTLGLNGQTKFTCKILGILYDEAGPGHHRIIAELDSSFKETGIIEGQSGSPVYTQINGNEYFVGVVSFGRKWAKGTVAGLTPAEDLLSVETYAEHREVLPTKPPILLTFPKPGDVVSILYAYGDLTLGGFGTVSYVDQETGKIFLFGHPLENLGPCEYVIVPATVLGVQSMLNSSFLIASPTQGASIIGVIEQDRLSGIMGTLGKQPKEFIPFTVKLTTNSGNVVEKKFFCTNNEQMAPTIGATAVSSIISTWSRSNGPKSIFLKGEVVTSAGTVSINDVFYGDSKKETGSLDADEALTKHLHDFLEVLLGNDFEKITVRSASLEAKIYDDIRTLKVKQVALEGSPSLTPGSVINIVVKVTQSRVTQNFSFTLPLTIPEIICPETTMKIVVGGSRKTQALHDVADKAAATDIAAFLKILDQKRGPSQLYISLVYTAGIPRKQLVQEMEINLPELNDLRHANKGRLIVQDSASLLEIKIEKPSLVKRIFQSTGSR